MEQLFIRILNMSLTAGISILAVLIIRFMLKRAPKIFSYALWAAVLFRLLCPFSFSSAVSLLGVLRAPQAEQGKIEYIPENIGLMEQPAVNLPVPAVENTVNESLPAANIGDSANPMQIVIYIGACVWMLGIVVMLAYGIVTYLKLRSRLKKAEHERDNIFIASDISTPFVCGILAPRIYLPLTLGDEEKRYILLHEQIHIRRGDHILRIISFFALCLHWFNPLVWLAFFTSGKDMEMSCDEAVIRKAGSGVKKEYSASLLSLASGRKIVTGIPLAFGEGETGSRINNILKYKKPAKIAAAVVAAVCILAVIALAANPGHTGVEDDEASLSNDEVSEVYYGVVSNIVLGDSSRMVVTVPRIGDMEIPEAKEVYPFIEIEDFSGLKVGDLVEITFPKGEEVGIMEVYPGLFSSDAESIVIKGEGFAISPSGAGRYMFTVPWGIAQDAETGDTLEIYYNDAEASFYYDREEAGQEKTLLAVTDVLSVDIDNYDVWVVLSAEEVNTFLAQFGHGITCTVIKQTGLGTSNGQNVGEEPNTEDRQNVEDGKNAEEIQSMEDVQYAEEAVELTREHLMRGAIVDGIYRVYVRSASRSARGIDRYIVDGMEDGEELLFLAFSDDCRFLTNKKINGLSYEETSYDDFINLTQELFSYRNPPMLLTFEDGLITEAVLENYYGGGISFDAVYPDTWYEDIQDITSLDEIEVLNTYYTLESREEMDIGDGIGVEQILVYTGNIGDGDSGIVIFNNEEGELICALSAHHARAGWNNIYVGERDGVGFIMTMHIEDRDNFGIYDYHVFRLADNGDMKLIAGSSFEWRDSISYDDELFCEWAEEMSGYLADSRLMLSTQEGELNTEHVSEADKYNYETLKR
ncbi:MAG: M56 family metallopeptidase [Lachnospiraceae bacterium]|nr:M56 family metallopeptidase [Lachnospiraceae bacterium]